MGVFAVIAPYNFPSMVPLLVSAVRHRDGQHLRREAERAGAALAAAPLPAHRRRAEAPAGRREHGQRRQGRRERHPRAPGHRGRLVRRLDRRSPSTSTSAAARPASACRRSAARRTSPSSSTTATGTSAIAEHRRQRVRLRRAALPRARASSSAWARRTASSRAELVERAKKIKVGYGMEPGVTMGPVISAKHKERVARVHRARACKEGAELLLDGRNREGRRLPEGALPRPDALQQGLAGDGDRAARRSSARCSA